MAATKEEKLAKTIAVCGGHKPHLRRMLESHDRFLSALRLARTENSLNPKDSFSLKEIEEAIKAYEFSVEQLHTLLAC